MKATDAASVFDGFAGRVVTAKRNFFTVGGFLPPSRVFSSAWTTQFRLRRTRYSGSRNTAGLGRCAPQQPLCGSDNQSAYEQSREKLENTG
jgi:hypothetical protein